MGVFSFASVPHELNAYVNLADSTFTWKAQAETPETVTLRLTSQTWRGIRWVHSLKLVSYPNGSDTAILYLTGGEPNPLDEADAETVAVESGLPTAMLFNVPAQPIFGKEEDALIAHTFDACLEDGDSGWPLLFPMAKSVIRAMDALEEWSNGRLGRFVLMGESKRAWTAWMAAATGDSRIIGIVPAAFDNLNMAKQMAHQLQLWDSFSPAIHDYTDLGLQERLRSETGKLLARMVDPYSYLPRITARILQVHGAKDEYWAPDAHSLYHDELPEGASLLTLPDEGHTFAVKSTYYRTVGAFARACASRSGWPQIKGKLVERRKLLVKLSSDDPGAANWGECRLYAAECASGDFSGAHWKLSARRRPGESGELSFMLPAPRARVGASFMQADCNVEIGGHRSFITLSTPTRLVVG